MIKLEYVGEVNNEKYTVEIDNEANVREVLYFVVKLCEAAGYSAKSFDYVVKDAASNISDGYGFKDFLCDEYLLWREE